MQVVWQVGSDQAIAAAAYVLGIPSASLSPWVHLSVQGQPGGVEAYGAAVSPGQMGVARLRAEKARQRRERDIAKKRRRTSRRK